MTTKRIVIKLGSMSADEVAQLLDMVADSAEADDAPEADAPEADDADVEAVHALAEASRRLSRCRDMLVDAAADADSGEGDAARDADEAFARAAREAESARRGVEDVEAGIGNEVAREDLREACWRIGRVESAAREAGEAAGNGRGGLAARLAGDAVDDALAAVGLVTVAVMAL